MIEVTVSVTVKVTVEPLTPAQAVSAVTVNCPFVVRVVVESITSVVVDAVTLYLLSVPPVTVNIWDVNPVCPEQLKVADVGVTASGAGVGVGMFFVALQFPAPSEPVLVYVPDIVFQSGPAVPAKVVAVPSALLRVRAILLPLTVPVIVAPSDFVPEILLPVCVRLQSFGASADAPDGVRNKLQLPLTSPSLGKLRNVPPQPKRDKDKITTKRQSKNALGRFFVTHFIMIPPSEDYRLPVQIYHIR